MGVMGENGASGGIAPLVKIAGEFKVIWDVKKVALPFFRTGNVKTT